MKKPNFNDIAVPEEKRGKAPMGKIYGKIEAD
jgi:hypothetical protein